MRGYVDPVCALGYTWGATDCGREAMACAVGRPVEVEAYAERVVIRQDGHIVGEHTRRFGRGQTAYDPWHYLPVLAKKPTALRNGAPFKDWPCPGRSAACSASWRGPPMATDRS